MFKLSGRHTKTMQRTGAALLEGRSRLVVRLGFEINAAEFVKQTVPQCRQPIKDKREESSHKPCGLRLPSRADAASRTGRSADPPQLHRCSSVRTLPPGQRRLSASLPFSNQKLHSALCGEDFRSLYLELPANGSPSKLQQ